jgi:hypothetical protein
MRMKKEDGNELTKACGLENTHIERNMCVSPNQHAHLQFITQKFFFLLGIVVVVGV